MTEILATKSRDVLGECTEEWQKNPVDPFEAAVAFNKKLGNLATTYDTYNSTSITAGGAKRFKELSFHEVVEWNRDMGLRYADHLHEQRLIDLHQSIDAASLGHVPSWGQHEYLEFWLLVIARPHLSQQNRDTIRKHMDSIYGKTDMEAFNNSKLAHSKRRPLYHKFERGFSDATKDMAIQPVGSVIQLIDRQLSLGCDVEARFATGHDIDILAPAYGGHAKEFVSSITDDKLRDGLGRLAATKASFIEAGNVQNLSLKSL